MKWRQEELTYLTNNYTNPSVRLKDIVIHLKKTRRAVCHKAARMNLRRPSKKEFEKITPDRNTRNAYDNKYYHDNKLRLVMLKKRRILAFKQELIDLCGGKCKRCGITGSPAIFDFHHDQGEKEGNVSHYIHHGSKADAIKEVKKCTLLCANCHRLETFKGVIAQPGLV